MENKAIKQSLLIGALTSSFGVFISKALGLIYFSPLSALAGEANMSFYSIAYTYYDFLLKISGAGIPFAIAAMVAKYCAKEDYKTAKLVKKLGTSIIMGMTFVVAIVFLFVSGPLAAKSMGAMASNEDVENLKIIFRILTVAVVIVPFLSALRGYYQGLKRLDLYASSQVLEQFVRVFTILAGGYLFVRVLKFSNITAIYIAMAAAGLAAFMSVIFIKLNTRSDDRQMRELVEAQTSDEVAKKELIKEILFLGLPYIFISFFGSASTLVNTTYFLDYVTRFGMDIESAKLSLGILQANCNKLLAIPQVLTLGFSSGLVPYLTESYEKKDFEQLSKQITQIFKTVLYLLIPCLLVFFFFSDDIYFVMYGKNNLELGSYLFSLSTLTGFTDTVAPILSSIMITLRQKKEAIVILLLSFVVKFGSFFPMVREYHAEGMVYSTVLCSLVAIGLYIFILKEKFRLKQKGIFICTVKIVICSLTVVVLFTIIRNFIPFGQISRLLNLGILGVLGIGMALTYLFITSKLKLPQEILQLEDVSIKGLLRKFKA